nr:hypothetical protein CFP56_37979 [Quercus suber]
MEKDPHPENGEDNDNVSSKSGDEQPAGSEENEVVEGTTSDPDLSLTQILDEVDRFLEALINAEDKSNPPSEVPKSVELLSEMVESMINNYVNASKASEAKKKKINEFVNNFRDKINKINKEL